MNKNECAPPPTVQDEMKKLEIYNLANASHWMDQTEDGVPYIESICNQRDTVSVVSGVTNAGSA